MTELLGFSPSWAAEFPNDNPALHDGASWVCLAVCGPARPVMRPRAAAARALIEPVIESPLVESPSAEAPGLEAPTLEALAVESPATMEVVAAEKLVLALALSHEELGDASAGFCEPLELDAIDVPSHGMADLDVFEFDSDDAPPSIDAAEPATPEPVSAKSEPAASEPEAPTADPFAAYVAAVVEVARISGNTRAAVALPLLLEGGPFDAAALPDDARERLVVADVLVRSGSSVSPSDSFAATAGAWRSVLRGTTNDLAACGESTLDGWSAELLKALGVGQGGATDVRRELRRRGVAAFGMLLAA